MTEEIGKGLNVSNLRADADGKIRLPVLYRLEGTEDLDGKDLLKFEMHRAGMITNTDLLTVDEHGIICWARVNLDGELVRFTPPQTMIAAPLKKGAAWNFDGHAGELKVQQHYDVISEEKIDVPAGNFQSFRIHCEQTTPNRMTIRSEFRWPRRRTESATALRRNQRRKNRRARRKLSIIPHSLRANDAESDDNQI